jgi:ABC-type multidrug transport system fused ATPase/permease subunit
MLNLTDKANFGFRVTLRARTRISSPPEQAGDRNETPNPETLWDLIKPFASKYRWLLVGTALLNMLPGLGIAFQTVAPKYLVDEVLAAPGLDLRTRCLRLGAVLTVWLFCALVLRMLCWYWSYRVFTEIRERVVMELRSRLFRHINSLCLRFHGQHSSGELLGYVFGSPLHSISGYCHTLMINVPNAACAFLVSALWIFFWDWALTLLLIGLVLATVLLLKKSSADVRSLHEDFQMTEMKIVGKVADILRGTRDVKLHALENTLARSFDESAQILGRKTRDRDDRMHRMNMRHEVASCLVFALLIGLASVRYLQGVITTGELFAYMGAYFAFQAPLGLLIGLGNARAETEASANRLVDLLKSTPSTPEPQETPLRLPRCAPIELSEVRFAYERSVVLRNINLTIPFGQHIALVGPSGAGKTTLSKLILRLYDPTGGTVSIGNVDLRQCRTQDLRRAFGIVPQEPYFFRDTIRENMKLVRPDADEELLRSVCVLANAWEFIEKMPKGLDEMFGEGACRLSTGQKQRLAIARALLNDPQYLIFDEATSALDSLNDHLIRDAFASCLKGRTAIFIAHRLSTIRNCHRIVVLKDGEIVQDGPFSQLSVEPGLFRDLFEENRF